MVKFYKELHWKHPLTGVICFNMQKKLPQKYQRQDHTGSIQKQPSAGI